MKKLKVGVIGVGSFGRLHCLAIKKIKYAELAGIFDINFKRAEQVAKEVAVKVFKELNNLINICQALIVCTPTISHYKIARIILSSKRHCLVEKPFTLNLKQANSLVKIAQRNKVFLQVGHIERFNSAFWAIKKFIKHPLFIETHRLSKFPQRNLDISVILDLMIHDIDIVLGLVKSDIKKIEAVGIKVLTDKPDIAQARIIFKNGCIANITSSRVSDETLRKLRVFTQKCYVSVDYKQQNGFIYKKKKNHLEKIEIKVEKSEPLQKELEEFVLCCLNKKKPSFSIREAIQSLKIALMIEKKITEYEKNIHSLW